MHHRQLASLLAIAVVGCTGSNLPGLDRDLAVPDLTPDPCRNFLLDGDETATDCGGPVCMPCDTGDACKKGRDCASGFCTNGKCDPPSCSDGARNGTESDKDCGGTCPACALGKTCNMGSDCDSRTCTNGVCVMGPCMNGKQDGSETDIDCGGSDCGPCDDGRMCVLGTDCKGMTCRNNVCEGATMCAAGLGDCDGNPGNGCETNIDADAKNCGACGHACGAKMECSSGKCIAGQASCKTVAGVRWCYNPKACGEGCKQVCAALGLPLTIDDATWFDAQSDDVKARAIAIAVGLPGNLGISNNSCLFDEATVHTAPGGPVGTLYFSGDKTCPARMRNTIDNFGIPCGPNSRRAICPCQ